MIMIFTVEFPGKETESWVSTNLAGSAETLHPLAFVSADAGGAEARDSSWLSVLYGELGDSPFGSEFGIRILVCLLSRQLGIEPVLGG